MLEGFVLQQPRLEFMVSRASHLVADGWISIVALDLSESKLSAGDVPQ
jgi:hypothetical protein